MSPASSRAGHDRWLLSYADLVTLLLAFFTVLYASSTLESRRPPGPESAGDTKVPVVAPVRVVPMTTARIEERLRQELGTAILSGRIELTRDSRGLVISLPEQATFAIGSAEVTPAAADLIARAAAAVVDAPNSLRVEGHTDDVPIHTGRFASNWELSTARASAVIALLIDRVAIPAARLSAAGYAEHHPRVPNTSPGNRARNRRIDLVVLD
jgi:chemotaxis protein MotB